MDHHISGKAEALALRYGADAIPPAGPWNDHIALLLSHRSIRGYRPDALAGGTLETLVAAAQSAATSSNMQTWSVVAVNDPAKRAELAELAGRQRHITQCPLFLVWLADTSRHARISEEIGVELEAIGTLETFLCGAIDAALAAQNAVVAAESLGLSTLYIGALRNDPARVATLLGLPTGTVAVFGLCVGYATDTTPNAVKPRLPQAAVLFHETYGAHDETGLRAAYDEKMSAFSSSNDTVHDTWTQRVVSRMGRLKALNGRDRLRAALHALGFPLA